MPRLKHLKKSNTHTSQPEDHCPESLPTLFQEELANTSVLPPRITQHSSKKEELAANEELIHINAILLYSKLLQKYHSIEDVQKLVNTSRSFLHMRRKYLNLDQDDLQDAMPAKPKIVSLG